MSDDEKMCQEPVQIAWATHFVLPRADIGGGRHAMVKDADYFRSQGGLTEEWGQEWIPVRADGLNHARLLAWFIGSGTRHPSTIAFTPPNHLTVRQLIESYERDRAKYSSGGGK